MLPAALMNSVTAAKEESEASVSGLKSRSAS
jgi:hypothetical protein